MASLPLEAVEDLTPDQVKSLYPSDLKLQYVQIFFRHGIPTLKPGVSNLVQVNAHPCGNVYYKLVSPETGVCVAPQTSSVRQLSIPQDNSTLYIIIVKSRSPNKTLVSRT